MRRCDLILLLFHIFGPMPVKQAKALAYLAVAEKWVKLEESPIVEIMELKPTD